MDKELKKLLKKYGCSVFFKKTRHFKIKHPCKKGFVIASCSSSDRNYIFNVEKDIKKLLA